MAIETLQNTDTGFVAVVAMKTNKGHYAQGGTGITSTKILKEVLSLRKNVDKQGNAHLPFCKADGKFFTRKWPSCFHDNERRFSQIISQDLNYKIDMLHYKGVRLRKGHSSRKGKPQETTGCCLKYYSFICLYYPKLVKYYLNYECVESHREYLRGWVNWFWRI